MASGRGRGVAAAALSLLAFGAAVVWFGVLRPERPATPGVPELSADRPVAGSEPAGPNRDQAASVPGDAQVARGSAAEPSRTPERAPERRPGTSLGDSATARPPQPTEQRNAVAPERQAGTRLVERPGVPAVEGAATPSFDIVRVEPSGDSVIAGRAAAGATVELRRNGAVHARVVSDTAGLFAFVPPPLPVGSHEIVLHSIAPDGARAQSRESVTIVVDPTRNAQPLVAMVSPDQPTVVLSGPDQPGDKSAQGTPATPARPAPQRGPTVAALDRPPPILDNRSTAQPSVPNEAAARPDGFAPPPPSQSRAAVKIVSVEAEEGGRLFVSAQASPGATIRLYLNETLVAPGGAGGDGRVTFAIGRGVRPGGYRVRLDDVDPVSGAVKSRAEVEFRVPAPLTVEARPTTTEPAGGAPTAAHPGPAAALPAMQRPSMSSGPPGPSGGPPPVALALRPPLGGGPVVERPPIAAVPSPAPAPSSTVPRQRLSNDPVAAPSGIALPSVAAPPPGMALPSVASPRPGIALPGVAVPPGVALPSIASSPGVALPSIAGPPGIALPGVAAPPGVALSGAVTAPPTAALPGAAAPSRETMALPGIVAPPAIPALPPLAARPSVATLQGVAPAPLRDGDPGVVVIPEINTAIVGRGDNLWNISRRIYGKGVRYTVIYSANPGQIRNPNRIYPGQLFVLPGEDTGGATP